MLFESGELELIPVKDIKVGSGLTVDGLIRMMGESGGFTAQKLLTPPTS